MLTAVETVEVPQGDSKFIKVCRAVARPNRQIQNAEWRRLYTYIRSLTNQHFGRPQEKSVVMERMMLFLQYLKEYEAYTETQKTSEPFWKYVSFWHLNYSKIETYLNLQKRAIAYPFKFIHDILADNYLRKLGDVFVIFYHYRPKNDMEWVFYFVQHFQPLGRGVGIRAQKAFLDMVHEFEGVMQSMRQIEHNDAAEQLNPTN